MLNDKKNVLSFRLSWPLIIVIISILMSVAYTTVNDVSLSIDGDAVAMQHKSVFVYDIQYKNSNGSNDSNNLLNVVSDTIVNSYVELSPTDSSSYVSYTITVLNNDDFSYEFSQAVFDEDFYNNENIIVDLNNSILPGAIIEPNTSLSFDVTFKYKNGVTPSTLINKLEAYVNFEFVPIAMLKVTNSSDTSAFRASTFKSKIRTITLQNEINVPDNAIESWDIGVSQTGNVMSYVVQNATDSSYYDLYIQSDTQLYGNENMGYWFQDLKAVDSINGISLLDTSLVTNMSYMFDAIGYDSTIFRLDVSSFDTSNVTNMSYMFRRIGYNTDGFSLDLSNFDTSSVKNMSNMFYGAGYKDPNFTLDVSSFDTSDVTSMRSMFNSTGNASVNLTLDVSGFDTSKVTDMSYMFANTAYNSTVFTLDVSGFDTGNVTNMYYTFYNAGYNSPVFTLDVSNFDTSNVTNMDGMFLQTGYANPNFTLDVSNFDTSNVTNMKNMFDCTGFNSTIFTLDVSGFDTAKVTDMNNMFRSTGYMSPVFTLDISGFDTAKVTDMKEMFRNTGYNSQVLTLDVSNFDTSNVTDMNGMFNKAGHANPNFTLDVSGFDTSDVTDMGYMFYQVGYANKSFQLDVSNFNTENVTDFSYMFYYVGYYNTSLVLDVSGFNTSKATDMSGMFYGVGHQSLVLHLDVSNFDTGNVTNMNSMFKWAGHENPSFYLDVSGFDTSKVTDMGDMFRANGIRNPNFTLDVSNFDTSNVTNMEYMFYWVGAVTTDFVLDLGGFDTSKVTSMYNMFNGSKVKTIYVSDKWNTSNVTSSGSMFSSCSNLVGGAGTTYTSSFTDKTYARIDGGTSQPGYFTLRPEGYRMLNYIESTGTQYIDTGFIPNQDTSVYMVATPLEIDNVATGHGFAPFGTAAKYNDSAYQFYIYSKAFQFNYNDTSTQAGNIGVAKAGQKVIINTQKNITTLINGTENLVFEDTYATFTAPVNLTLFALNTPSKASISGDMRLYSTKIWDNEVLIRDYVPCINPSGEAGLYDFVNNQFYGNSGTGTFKGA